MKKFFLCTIIVSIGTMLCVGSAAANTIKYDDVYQNWPGHFIDSRDEIGTPKIQNIDGIEITTSGTGGGYLESVVIHMTGRRVWDALFINTDPSGGYETWDYYVHDTDLGNTGESFYSVDPDNYTYILSTYGREDHPAGIADDGNLTLLGTGLTEVEWTVTDYNSYWKGTKDDEGYLTYIFEAGAVDLGDSWAIGYNAWCANDVVLVESDPAPVPEPATLLLLGTGLLGLAGIGRRTFRKSS